jgi:hypothetical protein
MCHVRDVIRLRSAGMATREIARRVGTAPSTVRLTIRRFRGGGADLAVARIRHRRCAGGPAVRQRRCRLRHAAGPSPAMRIVSVLAEAWPDPLAARFSIRAWPHTGESNNCARLVSRIAVPPDKKSFHEPLNCGERSVFA